MIQVEFTIPKDMWLSSNQRTHWALAKAMLRSTGDNLRVGELFAGYGGLGMAVKDVFPDAEVAWVSDIDKGACKILAHRFPNAPNLGDITSIDWRWPSDVHRLPGSRP